MGCGASIPDAIRPEEDPAEPHDAEDAPQGTDGLSTPAAGALVSKSLALAQGSKGAPAPPAQAPSATGAKAAAVYGKFRTEIKVVVKVAAVLLEASGMPGAKAVASIMEEVRAPYHCERRGTEPSAEQQATHSGSMSFSGAICRQAGSRVPRLVRVVVLASVRVLCTVGVACC